MKPRIVFIVIGIIIIVGAIFYFVFSWISGGGAGILGNTNSGTNAGQATSIAQAYPNAPTGTVISLGTSQGVVQMNNFYTASGTQLGEDGVLVIKQTSEYWFTYDPSASSFWIAISGTPFNTVRAAAEQDFLATLGVSQVDACKLAVSVGAPYAPNSAMNGQSFALSFCPAAAAQ